MGVPKFFRYISERYPCLSELVKEYQIPEFDNLYLDMNGIIHMCSHPDDGNPHFRITEEKIFKDVFHYIEVLFRMIRPQKLFFMAVDGVAPRAKMNQQRGRRFRSAKDADKQEAEALKKGEKLPEEARFDSNCITPGTVFMARLHEQLKYFVVDKISNDSTWQKCRVILSGHETPGEGEHKIMDYIRYLRAQPNYDPNTRHCLYGLDADLIMLGLCTHEPHFSLLREEVKFGKKSSSKRQSVPEEITFFLLHLSLMREYLELEFAPLQNKLKGFDYDFEKIIDDWVLMGFLVGNDFIPHLPNLHITNGALPILYKAYMNILPTLDGYINESGTLNLTRFEKFMENLSCIDLENFEEIRDDLLYMEAKTGRKYNAHAKVSTRPMEEWTSEENDTSLEALEPEKDTRDRGLAALIKETDDLCMESDDETDMSDEDDAFSSYKKDYYKNKLEYAKVTPEVMRAQAEGYVRAIQWNLNYYYNGCCSWSWFYPHHYAPYISDIKGFADLTIDFDYGKPFLPYEQLLAVLPTASKNLLPSCYHNLMLDENSIIKQYYPEEFQTDLNGKKQEWEAVVLVPFIDENLLLEAMSYCNNKLTEEEKERNSHGPMLIYTYSPRDYGPYDSPEYFPTVLNNHTDVSTMMYNDILLPREKVIKGAYPGVRMSVYYPGFPTMKHLKYKAELKKAKIKVFEQPSRYDNMIITIIPPEKFLGEMIPVDLLGTTIFVSWPHLIEAKVVAISNSKRKYISMGEPGQYNVEELTDDKVKQFKQEIAGAVEYFQRRMGIEFGDTRVLVHVQVMIGRRYTFAPNGRITLDKQFSPNVSNYPLQTIVFNISAYDTNQSVFRDIENVFPKDSICFTLTNPYYGSQGVVHDSRQCIKIGRIKICISVLEEPNFSSVRDLHSKTIRNYRNLYNVASQLSISNMLFSRITGSIFVSARNNEGGLKNINIGLDLKLNKKNKETPGYTRKFENTWCYSDKSADLVRSYCEKFPEVIEYLCKDGSFEEIVAEKIFGDDWEDKIKELQNWLRSLPIHSLEKQTCGSSVLEEEVVNEIERVVDSYKNTTAKKVTMQIKPNFLYRPEIQNGTLIPDPKTETQILDRVVNVREGFSVPFGLKGTVIAVKQSSTGNDRDQMYDVVFDKAFKDGMTLSCSEGRGYRLPPTAFINISYGQRLLAEKTGKTDEIITRAEASYHGSYQNRPQERFENFAQQSSSIQKYSQQQFNKQSNSAFAQFSDIAKRSQCEEENSKQFFPSASKQYSTNQRYAYQKTEKDHFEQWRVPQSYTNNIKNGGITDKKLQYGMDSQKINSFMPDFKGSSQVEKTSKSSQQQPMKVEENREFPKDPNNAVQNKQQPIKVEKNREFSKDPSNAVQNTQPIKVEKNREFTKAPNNAVQNTRCKVDTDFLKSILKIGEQPQSTRNISVDRKVNTPSTSQKNITDDMRSTSLDFNKLSQVASAPASIRLLTYYQSNGLGLPRYQYFSCGNMIQAQINVNKKIIVGEPAKTREEASENVAKDVLEVLMNKVKCSENVVHVNKNFPVPPKTWVEPENISKVDQKHKKSDGNQQDQHKAGSRKTEATAVLSNSFVPLQAVKNHIKPSNSINANKKVEESIKENIEQPANAAMNRNEHVSKDQRSSVDQNKPKKERKTRIAANFVKNN